MKLPKFDELNEDPCYCQDLGSGVWLMDDHRWALAVWDQRIHPSGTKYTLFHADYHWDANNDVCSFGTLEDLSEDELRTKVAANQEIKFDSFIAPAVIRGLFGHIHNFCLQDDESEPLCLDFLSSYETSQTNHDLESFSKLDCESPYVFDLCLDLFNSSSDYYKGQIWPASEIQRFLGQTAHLLKRAALVTVSLSFGYSGSVDDTQEIASQVLKYISRLR